ncbi:hypothetical protein [Streptomyces alanosinicus]|uniref:Secreted protein n=1 Tax=Streptomyces alanosinicus TaxID=68171 RepID=A0A919D0M6_9ACTN|nr:hypothetical protein [Streptomyces alanosinicus]GHD99117.1 hypothetical protein GCM10010339_09000 [Streptomyces alanosinicus]
MLSRKKIAAVSGLLGGLAVTCVGFAHASTAADPGGCKRDLQGGVTCIQRVQGEIPEDGYIPHSDTCTPMQPLTLPAALGNGTIKYGPEVTCSAPPRDKGDGKSDFSGLFD